MQNVYLCSYRQSLVIKSYQELIQATLLDSDKFTGLTDNERKFELNPSVKLHIIKNLKFRI